MTYRTRYSRNFFTDKRLIKSNRTEYCGYKYHSAFEASIAQELDLRLKANDIFGWDRQFKVEMWAYDSKGEPKIKKCHRIDFRIHNADGSFTLLEAKGYETQDYRERRNWLENLWLPDHPDYNYEVIYQESNFRQKRKK